MLVAPDETLVAKPGDPLRFETEGPTPSEAFLWAYHRDDVGDPGRTALVEESLDPALAAWTIDLPDGRYVLVLFRAWHGVGDASHIFALDVSSSGAS